MVLVRVGAQQKTITNLEEENMAKVLELGRARIASYGFRRGGPGPGLQPPILLMAAVDLDLFASTRQAGA